MKLPLLMTASVSTRGMKGAAFSDEERERMYVEALGYYLETLPQDQAIVFAENSGWDLGALKAKAARGAQADRVEFISVDPAICDQSRGKGYNEILLINAAIGKSAAIKKAGAFMKATGRYPIYNLTRYLNAAERFFEKGGQYYGDMKDHKVFDLLFRCTGIKWNGHAANTALFATTLDFYNRRLAGTYPLCNDYTGDCIECVWYKILVPFRGKRDCGVSLRLPLEPVSGGFQGTIGISSVYSQRNQSMKARIARLGGNCIRIFTPWFWF